jgi:transcriptional regulator with XRE-family HTH domain
MSIQLKKGAISERCQALGISRDELARRMQIATSTAFRVDRGDVTPSARFISAFMRVTGEPFEELFEVDADDEQVPA